MPSQRRLTFKDRMILWLAVGVPGGAICLLFVAAFVLTLFPGLQDLSLARHETAVMESMHALRTIGDRTGVRAYALDGNGVLTFRTTNNATLSADALLRQHQDLSPVVAQILTLAAPCSLVLRLDNTTYLCQHWHRDSMVGGWAIGRRSGPEVTRLHVSLSIIKDTEWDWWSAPEDALNLSDTKVLVPPKVQ